MYNSHGQRSQVHARYVLLYACCMYYHMSCLCLRVYIHIIMCVSWEWATKSPGMEKGVEKGVCLNNLSYPFCIPCLFFIPCETCLLRCLFNTFAHTPFSMTFGRLLGSTLGVVLVPSFYRNRSCSTYRCIVRCYAALRRIG